MSGAVSEPVSGKVSGPDYGRAHQVMRAAAGDAWVRYTEHDFVAQLCSGELPKAAFLHYLRQDYIFLQHFARAWALAAVKSANRAEMQGAIGIAANLILEETALHVDICAKAGISLQELEGTTERPENLAYTRFVLEAGYSGDLLTLLAAMSPCVFGYGEIGDRLLRQQPSEEYLPWIETYGGADYQQGCAAVGQLLDQALITRLGPDYQNLPQFRTLCANYTTATRLEIGFWDMGLAP